jgi:hypothetical protein
MAGNFGKDHRDSAGAEDLATPTIKSETYTTGRGGTGNIVKNDSADVARLAQDVEAPAVREPENFHYGRGGAANVAKGPVDETKKESKEQKSSESLAGRGKEFLDKIGLGGHTGKK